MKLFRKTRMKIAQQAACKSIIKHGFWFVDIPRTSSTSIRVELGRKFGSAYGKSHVIGGKFTLPQAIPDHLTAINMRDLLGRDNWERLHKFTIVRNPWDRILSMYLFRKKVGYLETNWSFSDYVNRLYKANETTKEFKFHGYRYGAADYLIDENSNIIVDSIIKYEDRAAGLAKVSKAIQLEGMGSIKVQQANSSKKCYQDYYNPETKSMVAELYVKDIDLFGYHF